MPISIHGKEYVLVNERITEFHKLYPKGSIQTEMTYEGANIVRCKATVTPETGRVFTGHAEERRDDGSINRTSCVENCETSAVGRALGMLGIGIETAVASYEEVQSALARAKLIDEPFPNEPTVVYSDVAKMTCNSCGKEHNGKFAKCYNCYLKDKK